MSISSFGLSKPLWLLVFDYTEFNLDELTQITEESATQWHLSLQQGRMERLKQVEFDLAAVAKNFIWSQNFGKAFEVEKEINDRLCKFAKLPVALAVTHISLRPKSPVRAAVAERENLCKTIVKKLGSEIGPGSKDTRAVRDILVTLKLLKKSEDGKVVLEETDQNKKEI